MKHIGALIVKFIIVTIILELILTNLTLLTYGEIVVISLAITVIAYLIGDLAILPNSNNTVATVADIGLSFIVLLLFNYIYPGGNISWTDALLASIGLGIGEWVFHKYLARKVLPANG